jgi:rubrerythrin
MDTKCCQKVSDGTRFGSYNPSQCKGKPFVERDGKTFCKRHDPVRREEKYQAKLKQDHADDCKQCGHHFYGRLEKGFFKFCPMCGTKR